MREFLFIFMFMIRVSADKMWKLGHNEKRFLWFRAGGSYQVGIQHIFQEPYEIRNQNTVNIEV